MSNEELIARSIGGEVKLVKGKATLEIEFSKALSLYSDDNIEEIVKESITLNDIIYCEIKDVDVKEIY